MDYRNWYCIQVASGCEKKVKADILAHKAALGERFIDNVEVAEVTRLTVDKSGKRKAKKNNILPGYVLVQIKKEEVENEDGTTQKVFPVSTLGLVKDTPNVLGFPGNPKDPKPMRPNEVKNIFDRIDDTHLEVKQNVVLDYQEGDILDVISGPFAGQKMEVVSVQGQKLLGQLDMFGRAIPAEFTPDQVYKTT